MGTAASKSSSSNATPIAALVIDADGLVVAANESASAMWGAAHRTLVKVPLSDLLGFDPPAEADPADVAWQKLKAAALNQWAIARIHPRRAAEASVRVRLERARGGAGTYLATVLPE